MKLITIMAASSALLAFAGTAAAQDNGAYGHIKKDSLRLDYTHLEARIGNADVYAITYGRRF